ncbi:hypothetical protein D3C81_1776060 [compost metagenome]
MQPLQTGGDIRARFADIQPDHLRALGGETADAGQADTRSGASDDRNLARQTCHGNLVACSWNGDFGGVYPYRSKE